MEDIESKHQIFTGKGKKQLCLSKSGDSTEIDGYYARDCDGVYDIEIYGDDNVLIQKSSDQFNITSTHVMAYNPQDETVIEKYQQFNSYPIQLVIGCETTINRLCFKDSDCILNCFTKTNPLPINCMTWMRDMLEIDSPHNKLVVRWKKTKLTGMKSDCFFDYGDFFIDCKNGFALCHSA